MILNKLSVFIVLFAIQLLLACGEDDSFICVPINLKTTTDSIVYEYSDAKNVERILYYTTALYQEDVFEYDNSERLSKVVRKATDGVDSRVLENYELKYNKDGKPWILNVWISENQVDPIVWTFIYDSDGRLSRREHEYAGFSSRYRYEYDIRGNVIRTYYTDTVNPEMLVSENLSFDGHQRFFASIPPLMIFYVYIGNVEPSRNNLLESKSHWFGSPLDIKYDVGYNSNGYVVSFTTQAGSAGLPEEFFFHDVNYECQ